MSEYLPAEEYRKKAWKAIYKFIDFVKPLLIKHDVYQVKAVLVGSVFRGEARCPREYSVYVFKTNTALSCERDRIEREDKIPFEIVIEEFRKASERFHDVNKIIEYIKEKYPDTLFAEIVEEERCSDVDAWIFLPDHIFEEIKADPEYYYYVDEGNEAVREIVKPLEPEIGFRPETFFNALTPGQYEMRVIPVVERSRYDWIIEKYS